MASSRGVTRIASVIKPKASWHRWLPLVIVGLIIIAAVLAVVLTNQGSSGGGIKPAHMIFDDKKAFNLIITDQTTKQEYKVAYPVYGNVSFEASSPKGQELFSLSVGDPKGGFVWIKDQKAQSLKDTATSALRDSIVLNNHHNIFFNGEGSVVYFNCASTCKLTSMDLASAKSTQVYDTGLKSAPVPPVYLLGVSTDGQTAYVRTLEKSNLGDNAAVYSINISDRKKVNTYTVADSAGYSPALSPDAQKVAYKISLTNKTYEIHVLTLANNSDKKIVWKNEALGDTEVFKWSPDSSKVLFMASNVNLPRAQFDSTYPNKLAYLDVPTNKTVELNSIGDSAHNFVAYLGWLDASTVVYQQNTTSSAYIFGNASGQAYSLDITKKDSTKIGDSKNALIQVVRY